MSQRGTDSRRRAWRVGLNAELIAALMLCLKGYRVLERRYRNPAGEIDLIVKRGNLVAFVEVKARNNVATALESVTPHQRQRIQRAAEAFVALHPAYTEAGIRFDVMAVRPFRWPVHLIDAWRPEL